MQTVKKMVSHKTRKFLIKKWKTEGGIKKEKKYGLQEDN